LETLLEKIKTRDDIFIYGRGAVGMLLHTELLRRDTGKAIHFCDRNAASLSSADIEVLTPDDAVGRYPKALFVLGTVIEKNLEEMAARLTELGVAEDNIAIVPLKTIKSIRRVSLGNIEYHLTEHCNLNCAGCIHFSSVADEEFADLQMFKNDMRRLSEILNGNIASVHLLGGEPLLHPQIEEFLVYTRSLLPKTHVHIVTNGILLLKMPGSFWETVKATNSIIKITAYPIKLNTDAIRKKAEEYRVRLIVQEHIQENWDKLVYDLEGRLDPEESFILCPRSNGGCVRLYKGRLYPCTVVGNAEHFNKRFNQKLIHTEADSIDIYSNVTPEDIFSFLANPVPFCRFCDVKNRQVNQVWSLSKNDINEYLHTV
jgi:MoaA/NifB/PqqE/SkfB family radical SAM enzyme